MASVSQKPANGQPVTRDLGASCEAGRVAMSRPLTTEEIEPFMYRPEPLPEFVPSDQDWAEYNAWSEAQDADDYGRAVRDHHEALQLFLAFFPE